MKKITTAAQMQKLALRWKTEGIKVGFVPTMGYLHEGHISLAQRARKAVGPKGKVVVSIYVNPTQFAPHEDLAKYPRDLKRDSEMCAAAGVDVLFVPDNSEMYPADHSTCVVEENLSKWMEGRSRPTHFRGVTTIVAKLFNLVLPDVAVFGAKDFQQAAVVRRMVRDLNFPVKLIVAPTVREPDGLALSSRNKYLSPDERAQAGCLSQAIATTRALLRERGKLPVRALTERLIADIESNPSAEVDYIAFFDPESFKEVAVVRPGVHMALAVFVGNTRLIDNAAL